MSTTPTTGAPVRVLRPMKLKGWEGRFISLDQQDPSFCWVAFGANGAHHAPPDIRHYTNQSRAPRKLLAVSGLEFIPERT